MYRRSLLAIAFKSSMDRALAFDDEKTPAELSLAEVFDVWFGSGTSINTSYINREIRWFQAR